MFLQEFQQVPTLPPVVEKTCGRSLLKAHRNNMRSLSSADWACICWHNHRASGLVCLTQQSQNCMSPSSCTLSLTFTWLHSSSTTDTLFAKWYWMFPHSRPTVDQLADEGGMSSDETDRCGRQPEGSTNFSSSSLAGGLKKSPSGCMSLTIFTKFANIPPTVRPAMGTEFGSA